MSLKDPTRDANGYPLQGVDVVPVGPKPSKLSKVMTLLQEANIREKKERDRADYWKRDYHRLNQDYIALQLKDLCSDCPREKDEAENGGTVTICRECCEKHETVRTLTRRLEEKEKETSYWQDCYETALRQIGDFPDCVLKNDGGSHDDPRQEFERLQDYYKGKITQNALLNKAGRLAAEKHMILKNPKIPSDTAVRMIKPLARQQARLTKRIRLGTAPTVGVGVPDEDEAMLDSPLEALLKQIIKKEAPAAVPAATPGSSGVRIKKESPSTSGIKKASLSKTPIPSTSGKKLSAKSQAFLKSLSGYAGETPYSPKDVKGKHPKAKKTVLEKPEEGWQGWGEKKKLSYGKGKGKTRSGWKSD